MELDIEKMIEENTENYRVSSECLGKVERLDDALGVVKYIEFVKKSFPKNITLSGLKVVLDCSNGAAYKVAPRILTELGASIVTVGVSPNGKNINLNCGSQSPKKMISLVNEENADFGIALDGDADRIICCDEKGNIIDGDQILAVVANRWKRKNKLSGKKIVATTMSNSGLEHYLNNIGLELVRTNVGDRYVAQRMLDINSNLGGEQSGHIILGPYSHTGDGILVALQLLAEVVEEDQVASVLLNKFKPMPQLIENVPVSNINEFNRILELENVKTKINYYSNLLKDKGRVNLRMSGTESVARIMIEGEDKGEIKLIAEEIKKLIQSS